MLSNVLESTRAVRDPDTESLFHTYCLIELRTSLALECKSLELNLDELQRVKDRARDRAEWGDQDKNRSQKFRITECKIPSTKKVQVSNTK